MMFVFDHTPHTEKQIVELVVASHTINIALGTTYRSIEPQNGPTFHEHAVQGPHATMGVVLHVLTHLTTHVIRNYLPIRTVLPYGQPNPAP
jgi:hypothetical protein